MALWHNLQVPGRRKNARRAAECLRESSDAGCLKTRRWRSWILATTAARSAALGSSAVLPRAPVEHYTAVQYATFVNDRSISAITRELRLTPAPFAVSPAPSISTTAGQDQPPRRAARPVQGAACTSGCPDGSPTPPRLTGRRSAPPATAVVRQTVRRYLHPFPGYPHRAAAVAPTAHPEVRRLSPALDHDRPRPSGSERPKHNSMTPGAAPPPGTHFRPASPSSPDPHRPARRPQQAGSTRSAPTTSALATFATAWRTAARPDHQRTDNDQRLQRRRRKHRQ